MTTLESTVSTSINKRIPSNGLTLDTALITQQPELVISHLLARRSNKETIEENINKIGSLRLQRNSLIVESDAAKGQRKTLSAEIGKLMKSGNNDEIIRLKGLVDQANDISLKADEKLKDVDDNIDKILSYLPNLLDDRVPDGDDDSQNVQIHSWGDDLRKIGSTYLWHDEIAHRLGLLNTEAATKIAGS
eukprot:gene17765-23366_t